MFHSFMGLSLSSFKELIAFFFQDVYFNFQNLVSGVFYLPTPKGATGNSQGNDSGITKHNNPPTLSQGICPLFDMFSSNGEIHIFN